jgi:two-component system OmpR family sensor kinase
VTTDRPAQRRFRRLRDRVAGTPLRVRLAFAVSGIALLGLAGAGAATLASLHSYLVGRIDADLQRFTASVPGGPDRFGEYPGDDGGPPGGPALSQCSRRSLPSQFYVEQYVASGGIRLACSSALGRQSPPKLPRLTAETANRLDSAPFTVASTDGNGQWRVVVTSAPDGDVTAVAESLATTNSTVQRLLLLEVAIGLIVLLLMAGAGYLVVRRSLRPLSEVEETAAGIAAGDLSRRVPPADERTEVGRLAAALNGMLAQIETAFAARARSERQARASEQRMRQFVGDASHELRTPLTSIRGFAELYRMGGAGPTTDPEVGHLMERIETESTRMGGLVEDLLLLARLDEKRPLRRQPVDLTVVAADAVHDAQALDRARPIRLRAPGSVVVDGDEQRLRQVVLNLVGNAVTHTPAGTPLEVTVERAAAGGPVARLSVVDHGPGIPPEQAEHVFERFWRADASRARAAGGAGLGLAIVAEIVAAHGGEVTVVPTPGGGATFTVTLPATA